VAERRGGILHDEEVDQAWRFAEENDFGRKQNGGK
jgi:hypothetical protein